MQGACKVNGRIYEWQVIPNTTQFSALLTLGLAPIDVLRIKALEDSSFDIAIRIEDRQCSATLIQNPNFNRPNTTLH